MKTKDNKKLYIIFVIIILVISILIYSVVTKNDTYAKETIIDNVKISNAETIDIYAIIEKNSNELSKEKIETKEEPLEFMTKYRTNKDLPKGTIQVIQEGREGIQQISIKKVYKEDKLISEEQISAIVTKSSIDKIVEIGGASYSSNYNVKVGDTLYVTADRAAIMVNKDSNSQKIATLSRNEKLNVMQIDEDWYRIKSSLGTGWIKKESTTFINPNSTYAETFGTEKSKKQLLNTLSFNMSLNKPSGLSLEQFKKVLSDSKDKNKIFENNAEYFYYIEKQYNINGLFVAAIGIHESAWGTSKIARNKTNLFGYGAYDSNPYNGAYTFSSYSESIDLMARVLTKYYLNPSGTKIYNGEVAKGTYYNEPTFSGVNKRYATDKNWANAVYNHMKYLYEKI